MIAWIPPEGTSAPPPEPPPVIEISVKDVEQDPFEHRDWTEELRRSWRNYIRPRAIKKIMARLWPLRGRQLRSPAWRRRR